jgi:hypothetical protein
MAAFAARSGMANVKAGRGGAELKEWILAGEASLMFRLWTLSVLDSLDSISLAIEELSTREELPSASTSEAEPVLERSLARFKIKKNRAATKR